MKISDIIKKQTTIIVLAVLVVTITAIGVSYSVFFDVKSNKNNQVVTAGTLKVSLTNVNTLKPTEPLSTGEGLKMTPLSYTVSNPQASSSLPATYKLYIGASSNNNVDLSKIKISNEGDATTGQNAKLLNSLTKITSIDGVSGTFYEVGSGKVAVGATEPTKYLRIWVDEENAPAMVNQKIQLELYIVSVVDEAAT